MTKFYRQGASGPEELLLVPAGGMSDYDHELGRITAQDREYAEDVIGEVEDNISDSAAQTEAVAEWLRKVRYEAVIADRKSRAALAAARAADLPPPDWRSGLSVAWEQGIEAAAKWLRDQGSNSLADDLLRALRPPVAPAESETDTVQFCRYCGAKTWFRNGVCEWFDNHKGDPRSALSASAPAGAPSEELLARLIYKVEFENLAETHLHPFDRAKRVARAVMALLQDGGKK